MSQEEPINRAKMWKGFALLVAVYLFVVYVIPRPEAVKPEGWRLTGLFLATIVGSIVEPIPAGALVLLAVVLSSIVGGLTITEALAGYSNSSVWLVLVAFFISGPSSKQDLRAASRCSSCEPSGKAPRALHIRWPHPTWCSPE